MELRNNTTYGYGEMPNQVKEWVKENWSDLNYWDLFILLKNGNVLEFLPNREEERSYEDTLKFFDGDLTYYGDDISFEGSEVKEIDTSDNGNPFENINEEYGRMQELAGLKQPEPRIGLSSTNQIEIGVFDSITSLPQLKSFLDERGSRGLLETIFKYYIGDEDLSNYTTQGLKEAIIDYWLES